MIQYINTTKTDSLSKEVVEAIKTHYGFNVVSSKGIYSYVGGVWEISLDDGSSYVFKYAGETNDRGLQHHLAVVEFCEYVDKNITEFVTQKFVKNKKGEYLTHLWDKDYGYILEKREIIHKTYITPEESQNVGHLMRVFHTKLKDFDHPGLGVPDYMRDFDQKDLGLLEKFFPKEEFLQYVQPFDAAALGLETTLIHGDWHQSNMSFTNPPFIFDLDTLCRGTKVEEIARSVTHWHFTKPKKELFENLVIGYGSISEHEVGLIKKMMVTICYKKYCEFNLWGDPDSANDYKYLAEYLKKEFNLP